MAPDVMKGITSGVDALMKKWSLFTEWFPDVQIQLKQLKKITAHSLVAFSTISFTIAAPGMLNAFPHLFVSGGGARGTKIALRLQGKDLVFQGSVRFDWDEENEAMVFTNARITPEGTQV
ncbi:hypothetical protein GN244_ATG17070 [Phytophthora infestans]|uniref:Uncharacterized protein n=1 Tax=Phytophthora infestans TaxID=4787 RepID=A0A833VVW9_PHYIN|nr:hypothetical protein GN244_ATG17070 [Phytophthora infestans]KAF4134803.1 hypothetical protein GN958_ATG16059 [Phytophthora infestans]